MGGLPGVTFSDRFVETYYTGDVTDAARVDEFFERAERLAHALDSRGVGPGDGSVPLSFARLWVYGHGSYNGPFAAEPIGESPASARDRELREQREARARERGAAADQRVERQRVVAGDARGGNFGDAPRYGTPTGSSVEVVGIHVSGERRDTLDSSFYGAAHGYAGAERTRVMAARDERLRQRVYFYTPYQAGGVISDIPWRHAHRTVLRNVYDAETDPLKLHALAAERARAGGDNADNEFESLVIDRGFDGYLNPRAFYARERVTGAVVLLGKHVVPTQHVGDKTAGPVQASRLTMLAQATREARERSAELIARHSGAEGRYARDRYSMPPGLREKASPETDTQPLPDEAIIEAERQIAEVEARHADVLARYDEQVVEWEQGGRAGLAPRLPAPNGHLSNLSRAAWVLVRTDNFKQWFGDWEQLARQRDGVTGRRREQGPQDALFARDRGAPDIEAEVDQIDERLEALGAELERLGPNTLDSQRLRTERDKLALRRRRLRDTLDLGETVDGLYVPADAVSHVLDENNEPRVVYHGTKNAGFRAFRRDKLGENTQAGSARLGHFFSGSEGTAGSTYYVGDRQATLSHGPLRRELVSLLDEIDQAAEAARSGADTAQALLPEGFPTDDSVVREAAPLEPLRSVARALVRFTRSFRENYLDATPEVTTEHLTAVFESVADTLFWDVQTAVDFAQAFLSDSAPGYETPDFEALTDRYGAESVAALRAAAETLVSAADPVMLLADAWPETVAGIERLAAASEVLPEESDVYEVFLNLRDPEIKDFGGSTYREETYRAVLERAQENERGGAILENTYDGGEKDDIFVVFDEANIKAVGNWGTFDKTDTDIYHSRLSPRSRPSSEETAAVRAAWLELAKDSDLFQYAWSPAVDLPGVFAAVDSAIVVSGPHEGSDGVVDWHLERELNGEPAFGTVHVFPDRVVEVDLSGWGRGQGGSAVYAALANWTYNTGRVFVGDRAGISGDGMVRRLENMASAALKAGGATRHIAPHPEMLRVLELGWRPGDDAYNLEQLLLTSQRVVRHGRLLRESRYDEEFAYHNDDNAGLKALDDIQWDPVTRGFYELVKGRKYPITNGEFDAIAYSPAGRAINAGRNTLKRAVLTAWLLREAPGQSGVLAGAGRVPGGAGRDAGEGGAEAGEPRRLRGTQTEQIAYSRLRSNYTVNCITPGCQSSGTWFRC